MEHTVIVEIFLPKKDYEKEKTKFSFIATVAQLLDSIPKKQRINLAFQCVYIIKLLFLLISISSSASFGHFFFCIPQCH